MGDRLALLRAGRLTTYPTREAFVADPETGRRANAEFWLSLPASCAADHSDR